MILDLFAGPGGWDHGLRLLGRTDAIGVEWDAAACDTARAAGHRRVQADVATDPLTHWGRHYEGLIASPPCQGFSNAGKGRGRADSAMLMDAMAGMGDGTDPRHWLAEHMTDHRSLLALEPLRYAVAAHRAGVPFQWIAWEQVPAVLPLWHTAAEVLRELGYDAEAVMVRAEQFGVPQTRKRAILRATLDPAGLRPLTPTHSRYHERTPARLDPDVKPWVSMAEGLGWGLVQRPSYTVCAGGKGHAIGDSEWGGESVRKALREARDSADPARWAAVEYVNGTHAHAARRSADKPAPTVMFGARSNRVDWQLTPEVELRSNYNHGATGERTRRSLDEPATTITSRPPQWSLSSGTRGHAAMRRLDEPAPALAFGHDAASFAFVPTGTTPEQVVEVKRATSNNVRITVQEAGLLQSFPADYPWQGTRSDQYRQAGDAVPPVLAAAILDTLL